MQEAESNGVDWEAVERGGGPMKWLREKQYIPLGWKPLRSQHWAGTTKNRGWRVWAPREPRTSWLESALNLHVTAAFLVHPWLPQGSFSAPENEAWPPSPCFLLTLAYLPNTSLLCPWNQPRIPTCLHLYSAVPLLYPVTGGQDIAPCCCSAETVVHESFSSLGNCSSIPSTQMSLLVRRLHWGKRNFLQEEFWIFLTVITISIITKSHVLGSRRKHLHKMLSMVSKSLRHTFIQESFTGFRFWAGR